MLSITLLADIDDRRAMNGLNVSFPSFDAIFQSSTAAILDRRSPMPAARNLYGAFFIIARSTTMATGSFACIDVLEPLSFRTAREETTPSWLSIVGNAIHGLPARKDAYFAASIALPPPAPIMKSNESRCFANISRYPFSIDSGFMTFMSCLDDMALHISEVMPKTSLSQINAHLFFMPRPDRTSFISLPISLEARTL